MLLGRGGADYLDGGQGRDTMDGGPAADLVLAAYDGSPDTVRCGAGADVVNADLIDAVARDCELVGRRLSQDPYRNDGAQHESEVEPDSFTFGRTTVATFQVGRRFEGGATNVGFAVTTDDGRTWRSGFLPGLTSASVPARTERESERPGGRIRRSPRHLAHLHARARKRRHAARDQPLDRRIHLERAL